MGCAGCGSRDTNSANVDKRGVGKPAMETENKTEDAYNMSYAEYVQQRSGFRARAREIGNEKIKTLSDDYKRIQIDELLSVYNHDEVHFKLTPSQALMALWEFAHHPGYEKIFDEFKGLREAVDKKYEELKNNRIEVTWKPL